MKYSKKDDPEDVQDKKKGTFNAKEETVEMPKKGTMVSKTRKMAFMKRIKK